MTIPFDPELRLSNDSNDDLYFSAAEEPSSGDQEQVRKIDQDDEEVDDLAVSASPTGMIDFSHHELSSSSSSMGSSGGGSPAIDSYQNRRRVMFDLTKNRIRTIPDRHQLKTIRNQNDVSLADRLFNAQSEAETTSGNDAKEHAYFKEEFDDYSPWKDEWSYNDGQFIFDKYWDAFFFVAQVKRIYFSREQKYRINSQLLGSFGDSNHKGSYWHPDGGKQLLSPYVGVRFSDRKLKWECYIPNHRRENYGIGSFGTSREAALGFNYLRQVLRKKGVTITIDRLNTFASWERQLMDMQDTFLQIDDYLDATPLESFSP